MEKKGVVRKEIAVQLRETKATNVPIWGSESMTHGSAIMNKPEDILSKKRPAKYG
ncbi:hypothetical protein D018_1108 [Vibrio parahaemolyticus VP2007-007]|nr:hypothetical protein D018_1108 [Vibrio parahaemolyticus VP2007-007]